MHIIEYINFKIRPLIFVFLQNPDIRDICSIYGSQALNYYIVPYLQFKTYDVDILVNNKYGETNITTRVGSELVNWLNMQLGDEFRRLFPNKSFSITGTTNHLNIKNTVKLFIGNKPLIDISEEEHIDSRNSQLYPDVITSEGYKIKSFEWLILNIINILKNRTEFNNHIWDKTICKAQRILFMLNHKGITTILNYNFNPLFQKNILLLAQLVEFNKTIYYSDSLYEQKCMQLEDINNQLTQIKNKLDFKEVQINTVTEINQAELESLQCKCISLELKIQNELEIHKETTRKVKDYMKLTTSQQKKIHVLEKINNKLLLEKKQLLLSNNKLFNNNTKYKDKYSKLKEKYKFQNIEKVMYEIEEKYKKYITEKMSILTNTNKQLQLKLDKIGHEFTSFSKKSKHSTKLLLQKDKIISDYIKKIKLSKEAEEKAKLLYKRNLIENVNLQNKHELLRNNILENSNEYFNILQTQQVGTDSLQYTKFTEFCEKLKVILQ